jgi:HNH endonuclease/AP2 domain
MSCTIDLRNGSVLVLDERYYLFFKNKKLSVNSNGYVLYWQRVRVSRGNYKKKPVYLHKIICKGSGIVDHINGNRLDNRAENLRLVTKSENAINCGKANGDSSSGFRGVSYSKPSKKWRAYATYKGKRSHLGFFNTDVEAALARDKFWESTGEIFIRNIK